MTEIAIDRLPQPEPELDRQRTVEAIGDAQLRGEFLRRIGGKDRHQRIAGRDVHQQKAHQRHADDDRDHINDTPEHVDEHRSPFFFLLPLWEKVARSAGWGLRSLDRPEPLTRLQCFASKATSPTRGEVKTSDAATFPNSNHGVMDIGEKSTNQLLGCTNPWIFGLIARGATSCAT